MDNCGNSKNPIEFAILILTMSTLSGQKNLKIGPSKTGRKYHDHTSYGVGDVMYVYEQRLRM